MKKTLIAIALLFTAAFSAQAQRIGVINTEQILARIPAYVAAQEQLNALNDKYKATIEAELGRVEALYKNYQENRASMTASQRQSAENEIIQKERVVQEKQKIYFGEDGIMSKRAEELLGPIRKQVDKAISDVAKLGGYDLIIDVAAVQGIVYKNPDHDLSQAVLVRYQEIVF